MTTPPPTSTPADASEELALELGRYVRDEEAAEQDARPPEWEAALAGELDFDTALARRREAEDPDLERAAELFRPFSADEQSSLVDGLLASITETETQTETNEAEPADEQVAEVVPLQAAKRTEASSAKPKPEERASSWWVPGGMLAAAAAAILMWWVWPPSEDVRGPQIAQLEPLPSYSLEVDGGLAKTRGEEPAASEPDASKPARYQRNTTFSWLMRPEVDVGVPVGVRGFVFASGGSAGLPLALDALTQRADSGVLRVSGEISSLDLEPGRYTIMLAVGRPDDLPTQAAQVAAPKPEGSWQVHRVEIIIED